MEEVWSDIKGYPNYSVSNYGDVVNLKTGRKVKPRISAQGYYRVRLYGPDGGDDIYLHQLVAVTFFEDFVRGTHVGHRNGNKRDNSVLNLRLKYRRDVLINEGDKPRDGWGKRIRINETGMVFRTVRDCARYINGDYSSIYRCLRGERQMHLGYTFEYFEGDD